MGVVVVVVVGGIFKSLEAGVSLFMFGSNCFGQSGPLVAFFFETLEHGRAS